MKQSNFENAVVALVKGVKGCQFISMGYVSEPSLNKAQKLAVSMMSGNSEIVEIKKISFGQFQINYSYENAVNNRGEKESGEKVDFISSPLRWGQWVEGQVNKLIEHKGELYLRFYGVSNGKVESKYYIGGIEASKEQVEFIKQCTERGSVKTQESVGLVENQVIARSVKISNITEITINGVKIERKNK